MAKWILFESDSFTDATCDTALGSTTITCNSSSSIAVGQWVHGSGIPSGSRVATVNSAGSVTSFTISVDGKTSSSLATFTATNVSLVFIKPSHKTDNVHAYPIDNVNAMFITAHNTILIYVRNPVQSTEAVSDDIVTLTTEDNVAYTVLNSVLKLCESNDYAIRLKIRRFIGLKNLSWAAGT